MDVRSFFGRSVVSFFGISTLTTGIYNAWITFDDLTLANRLSFYLLLFILGLFVLENLSRKKAQYHTPTKSGIKKKASIELTGKKSILAFSFCFLIFFISFLFPVMQMLYWTVSFPKHLADLNLIK